MSVGFKEYIHCSDAELIERLRQGEKPIMDYICMKYKNLVKSKASSMYILGADTEDLIQEGMIGLFHAMQDYDPGRDASFYTFAELCISRRMYTAVQASNRKKHLPLNNYISLDAGTVTSEGEEREGPALEELLQSTLQMSPEQMVLDKENVELLEKAIDKELSDFEKQVLDLLLTGMGYVEIAHVLGREEKATDNALQRLKSKIRKVLLKNP